MTISLTRSWRRIFIPWKRSSRTSSSGVFTNATYEYTPNPDLPDWDNDHPFPPEITVDSPYLHRRMDKIGRSISELEAAAAAKVKADPQQRKAFAEWREAGAEFLQQHPSGWVIPAPEVVPFIPKRTGDPTHRPVS